jgi:hypothetical protein
MRLVPGGEKMMLQLREDSRLKNRRGTNKRKEPREGTKLREIYDRFMANKGVPITISFANRNGKPTNRHLDDLRDYYGLDIRAAGRGLWVLAGAWDGTTYTSYTSYTQEGTLGGESKA